MASGGPHYIKIAGSSVYVVHNHPLQRSVTTTNRASVSNLYSGSEYRSLLANKINHLSLENQLNEFVNSTTLTTHDLKQRELVIQDLSNILGQTSCTLYPVGSFYTGLCHGLSDLDIFADTTGLGGIYEVGRVLQEATNTVSRVNRIDARIPLINFVHVQTGIQVDLSFGGSENNGRRKSGLIDLYLNVKPNIFRPLLLLILYWSKSNGLAGAKELKNYALSLLVFNFLTRKGLIYSVQSMIQKYHSYSNFGYNKNKSPSTAQLSQLSFEETIEILKLAQEFFNTFAQFDYEKFVVCCLTSEWIPKDVFSKIDRGGSGFTPNTASYVYNEWSSSQKSGRLRLNYESVLCIQDPFDLRTNVAYMVNPTLLYRFKMACRNTAPRIQMILNSSRPRNCSSKLMSIF